MLSNKNLAAFTKSRPSLKVMGTPSKAGVSSKRSVFTAKYSRTSNKPSEADRQSYISGVRVRKNINAEMHKRRIMDVVNQLNEDELEKVSEMLKVSEALETGNEAIATEDGPVEANDDDEGLDEEADQVEDLKSEVRTQVT